MSLEQNNINKEEENKISLNKNDFIKQKNPKEADNPHQKKSETQYPSSAVSSIQNQDLIKTDSIKFIPEINNNANESSNKFNFFQSKKVSSSEIKEYENNSSDKMCCYCSKTSCIKKYCECFSNNRYCKNCHCTNCKNIPGYLGGEIIKEGTENDDKVFCTCTKSNCNKKYCECYKSNQKCTDKCRCINCKNGSQPSFSFNVARSENIINNSDINQVNNYKVNNNINNDINSNDNNINEDLDEKNNIKSETINLEEEENEEDRNNKIISRKSSLESNNSYQIQRVSIFIDKYQTVINVEKFTKEMMMVSKKRKKSKK